MQRSKQKPKTIPLKPSLMVAFLFAFGLLAFHAHAQQTILSLSADSLRDQQEISLQSSPWLFRAGDDPAWAESSLNDSSWQKVNPEFGEDDLLPDWKGIGWFRKWIQVDSSLFGKTLALRINHDGASEIYVDGTYKRGFGTVASNEAAMEHIRAPHEITPLQFHDGNPHLIAIRYAHHKAVFPDFLGFQVYIGDYFQQSDALQARKTALSYLLVIATVNMALALLHFFLFLFYPKQKQNLYYSLFVLSLACGIWAIYAVEFTTKPNVQYFSFYVYLVANCLAALSTLLLFYTVSYGTKFPRWKVAAAGAIALAYLIIFLSNDPSSETYGFHYFLIAIVAEGLWSLRHPIRSKQPGVWLIGLGMLLFVLFFIFSGANLFDLWVDDSARLLTMFTGGLSLPLCFSLYLALDFARTNQDLSAKLKEVRELSEQALASEAEKRKLITEQAEQLEVTVRERTEEVRRQADKLREMDTVKSRFFINLTHEFRTPLTLISGPAQRLLAGKKDAETMSLAKTIRHNAERLLQLINQLLDLGKLEAGKMEVVTEPVDLAKMIRMDMQSFSSLAQQQGLGLHFQSDRDQLWALVDVDKIKKIVLNLVTNAVKFTPPDGSVLVRLAVLEEESTFWLVLTIKDTGTGIKPEKMPFIFDRFYQVDPSDTRTQEGSGIGLALTKELVELMGGNIAVDSREGGGTEVNVRLPYVESDKKEIIGAAIEDENVSLFSPEPTPVGTNDLRIANKEAPLLLIIEDNEELRSFIRSSLSGKYRTLTAANGEEGIRQAKEQVPDLVITDLMMPLMDGYQVCSALKQHEETSHVPIVMLTAKADRESRIEGLETGADAYLGKPFDQRELTAVIDNLIHLQRQLRKRYGQGNLWLTETSDLPSMEKAFLEKVKNAVEVHLDDEQYSVDRLGADVGLSRTQLHRKLKSLINQGPGELIRAIRLEKAYELLRQRAGTVAEVAYMVGFGNPNNFSTSFSRYFGFTPSEVEEEER